jgi:hypothetical protein
LKNIIAPLLLVSMLCLARDMSAGVKYSMSIEGTVVRAHRFLRLAGYTTEITFQASARDKTTAPRIFCGDWEKQVNRFAGQYIRLNLRYKEYAPDECMKIKGIEVPSRPRN